MKGAFKLVVLPGAIIQAIAPDGTVRRSFRFSDLPLPLPLREASARAFCSHWGHCKLNTLVGVWGCFRSFARGVDALFPGVIPLPVDTLDRLRKHLADSGVGSERCQSAFNVWRRLVSWMARNQPSVVVSDINLRVAPFTFDHKQKSSQLDEEGLKSVVEACYSDIQYVVQLLDWGQKLIKGDEVSVPEHLRPAAEVLLEWCKNGPPEKSITGALPASMWKRLSSPLLGRRRVTSMLYLTPRTTLPFYIAILAQSSGNAGAIWDLSTDCIRSHVRPDVEVLVWGKDRAGNEQKADFPQGKQWAAPSLVRMVLSLTEPLRPLCNAEDALSLFICWTNRGPKKPTEITMHHELAFFIERHKLPNFDFRDFRRIGAKIIHKSGGTIHGAQKRLNHRSSALTERYTPLSDRAQEHSRIIAKFQGLLVSMSKMNTPNTAGTNAPILPEIKLHQTVFGFSCKDPLSGVGGNSPKGTLCLNFAKCSACPGSIVVLDDVRMIARLLATSIALEGAKKRAIHEGWFGRFEILYLPTLMVITEQILPAVADEILQAAKCEIAVWKIPYLE